MRIKKTYRSVIHIRVILSRLCYNLYSTANSNETSHYPIEINSLNQSFVYTAAPEKIVALDYISAQILVALGLGDRIVALAPAMNTIDEVKDEYRTEISE